MPEREAAARFEILREILELAREQRTCLEDDRIDDVIELMDRREELVEQLRGMVGDEFSSPPNVIAFPSPSLSEEMAQNRLAIDALIRGILDHDVRNEQLLDEKMREVREQLPPLQRGRRATHRYRVESGPSGYVDLVS